MAAQDMPDSQNRPQNVPDLKSMPILIGLTVKHGISQFKRIYYSPKQESWTLADKRHLTTIPVSDVETIDIDDQAPTDHTAIKHVTKIYKLGDHIVLGNEYDGSYHIFVLREPENPDVYFVTSGSIMYEGETTIVSTADIIRYDSFANIPNSKPAIEPEVIPDIEALDVEQNKFPDADYDNDIKNMEDFMKIIKGGQLTPETMNGNTPANKYAHYMHTFSKLVDIIITMPIVFKLNSLTIDGLKNFIDQKDVGIQTVPDQNVKFTPKNAPIQLLFDFLFVPMNQVGKLKTQKSKEYLNEEIDRLPAEADLENYSKIKTLFGNPPPALAIMHAKRFCEFALSQRYEYLETQQVGMDTIAYFFYSTIHAHLGKLAALVPQIQNFENQYNGTFKKTLDAIIADANSNQILTFLKLTNFENKSGVYNQRFHVRLNTTSDKTPNMMILDYNDDPFPYYVFTPQGSVIPNVAALQSNPTRFTLGSGNQVLNSVNAYDATFLFGKFQEIFPPQLTNSTISQRPNIGTILTKIEAGSPVFLMGYGASGSGKTSSLIYFKGTNTVAKEDGILIELCKALANKGYDTLSITVKEYFISNVPVKAGGEGQNTIDSPLIYTRGPFGFSTGPRGGFALTEESAKPGSYEFLHTYRTVSMDIPGKKTKQFAVGTGLGEVLIQLIDTDRMVKATTNNPNSSRSHSLVFITLKNSTNDKLANIIVGDFAGVENEFKCESPLVLQQFLNVKRESPGDNNNALYYSVESKRANIPAGEDAVTFDPIYGGKSSDCEQIGGGKYDQYGIPQLNDLLRSPRITREERQQIQQRLDLLAIKRNPPKAAIPPATPTKQSIAIKPPLNQTSPLIKKVESANTTAEIVLTKSGAISVPSTNPVLEYLQAETPLHNFVNLSTDPEIHTLVDDNLDVPYVLKAFGLNPKKLENESIYAAIQTAKLDSLTATHEQLKQKVSSVQTFLSQLGNRGNIFDEIIKRALYTKFLNVDDPSAIETNYVNPLRSVLARMNSLQQRVDKSGSPNSSDINNPRNLYVEYRDYRPTQAQIAEDLLVGFKTPTQHTAERVSSELDYYNIGKSTKAKPGDLKSKDTNAGVLMSFTDEIRYLQDYLDPSKPTLPTSKGKPDRLNYYGKKIDTIIAEYHTYLNADAATKANGNAFLSKQSQSGYAFYTVDPLSNKPGVHTVPINIRHTINVKFYQDLDKELDLTRIFDGLALRLSGIDVNGTDNGTTIHDINEKIDTIRDATDNKIGPLYDRIYDIILETKYRLQYGRNICVNRRTEGTFINDSLSKIRETIREILVAKTEGIIYPLPNFIDICMDTYCPTHKNCFLFDDPPVNNTGAIPSLLFADIQKYLIETGGKQYANKNSFYKDVIVAVFCVFNISRRANNPSPVPYVDINKLKQLFFYEKENVNDLSTEILTLVKRLEKFPIFVELINLIDEVLEIAKTADQLKENPKLKSLIDTIDKNNSASAVGTLEFLDQISKFNSTNHICYSHENPHLDENQITFYKSDAFSQEIYPKK